MISDRDADLLITGANVGPVYIMSYLAFLDGFEGSTRDLAAHMGMATSTAVTHIRGLRDLKLIRVVSYGANREAVYILYDGQPDAELPPPNPQSSRSRKVAAVVGNYERRQKEAQERMQRFVAEAAGKKTKHGTEVQNGAVRIHRMR